MDICTLIIITKFALTCVDVPLCVDHTPSNKTVCTKREIEGCTKPPPIAGVYSCKRPDGTKYEWDGKLKE